MNVKIKILKGTIVKLNGYPVKLKESIYINKDEELISYDPLSLTEKINEHIDIKPAGI